jgi:hypothetical protein
MTIKTKIDKILAEIDAICDEIPESKPFGDFITRGIVASGDRAALWDSRLSSAARLTVASAAMDFVSHFLFSKNDISNISTRLNTIVDISLDFAPLQLSEHKAEKGVVAPHDWEGPKGGPFKYIIKDYPFMLVRRPLLPGGNWTLLFSNIPVSFGETAIDAAEKSAAFIKLRETLGVTVPS